MSTPAGGGTFGVNNEAMRGAQTALNGMALDSRNIGAMADQSTEAAAKAHNGWDSAGALRAALAEWHEQVDSLTQRLNRNSAAMQQTTLNYQSTNGAIADLFKVR